MSETACTTREKCLPCEGGIPPLGDAEIRSELAKRPGWTLEGGQIVRTFTFKNYHQTMAFVNAVAWIAHTQNHHPELVVGYKTCRVSYSTHAIGGLSRNDFICAAEVDALLA